MWKEFCRPALPTAALLLCVGMAHADVFGRVRITVQDTEKHAPVQGAQVVFEDTANVEPDIFVITDARGSVLSPPLENRVWRVTTEAVTFENDLHSVTVAADTTTEVDVRLNKKIIQGGRTVIFLRRNITAQATPRDRGFTARFPVTAGNPQSLPQLLATVPGIIPDSVNVVHPRAEHSSVSLYLNGFQLPGVLQGKAGQILSPQAIQNADILTGGYAPEYGSETGAILNLALRSGPITPFQEFSVDGGGFSTYDGEVTIGGQAGQALETVTEGPAPRRFRYLLALSDRSTASALEPPQPDKQTAHNAGQSATLFGSFDYLAGSHDQLTLTINSAPARTQTANRTGLSDHYAAIGENYGYGGARNADGAIPGGDPALLGGQTLALPSQESAHQDVYQNEDSTFGLLNYRHAFGSGMTGVLSYGLTHSRLDVRNHNPAIDPNALNSDGTLAQIDNSIEYNPTLLRSYDQGQAQGSLTLVRGPHTYKAGFVLDGQRGDESYQFVPQSQLALDALAGIDTRLAPAGMGQVDSSGEPVLDVLGNQVYLPQAANNATPILRVHRSGYYRAGYVQDTWNATHRLTVNYGLRLDVYRQTQNLGQAVASKTEISPRLNLAYAAAPRTLARASFNHLFSQPPLAQGAILGQSIQPQTQNQYEVSLEQQLGAGQSVKIAYFAKDTRNSFDTGILIPFTQIGAYTTVNFTSDSTHGTEISYDRTPPRGIGWGGYLAYANMLSKDGGVDNAGEPAPTIKDHDQRNTLSTGVSYTLASGASAGLSLNYGSGETVSGLTSAFFGTALNNGSRVAHTTINLRLSGPHRAGRGGLEIEVANLFDERHALDFNSGFSGTRFEQGRRVLLRATGNF